MRFPRFAWAILSVLLACGGDKDDRSECEQLQSTLCTRTRACAEESGFSPLARHDAFLQECLRSELQCRPPIVGGDFELCRASLETLPCDYVVEQLHDEKLVSSSSCEEYIPL
ncbi:MAG: hypothetical protein RLZZ450_3631 [Pseudomonadota bacterium]